VLALGNSGTGKTHIGLALGMAACRQGFLVRFTTASLTHELIEARDERRLMRYQKILARQDLLVVD
jgi:DNA replication protein DnaC